MEDAILKPPGTAVDELDRLVQTLRGENGCPWDRKQTPQSVAVYLVEEVFELVDAIESGRTESILEELGDVLFHIAFIARIFEERGEFNLDRVARSITTKMIRRHPHVFGDKEVHDNAEVVRNWQQIKLEEQAGDPPHSRLDSVPGKLPALLRAYRISDRAAKSGFEWSELERHPSSLRGVAEQLQSDPNGRDQRPDSRTFGDLFFDLVNLARLAGIHPESALAGSVNAFVERFKQMEKQLARFETEFGGLSRAEKQDLWDRSSNGETETG
jgi:tetrapyrrole methylase family protein/MazG family protein